MFIYMCVGARIFMYVCLCLYVYVCICVYVYMYICMNCMCVYMCVYVCAGMCACVYIYMCVCVCVYIYIYYIYIWVCVCIYVYVCGCVYRYISTHRTLISLDLSFFFALHTIIQFVDAKQQVEIFILNWHKRTFCPSVRSHLYICILYIVYRVNTFLYYRITFVLC